MSRFWFVSAVCVSATCLAAVPLRCQLPGAGEQTVFEAPYTVDTSDIKIDTCRPQPQCVDPEPAWRPE